MFGFHDQVTINKEGVISNYVEIAPFASYFACDKDSPSFSSSSVLK